MSKAAQNQKAYRERLKALERMAHVRVNPDRETALANAGLLDPWTDDLDAVELAIERLLDLLPEMLPTAGAPGAVR